MYQQCISNSTGNEPMQMFTSLSSFVSQKALTPYKIRSYDPATILKSSFVICSVSVSTGKRVLSDSSSSSSLSTALSFVFFFAASLSQSTVFFIGSAGSCTVRDLFLLPIECKLRGWIQFFSKKKSQAERNSVLQKL